MLIWASRSSTAGANLEGVDSVGSGGVVLLEVSSSPKSLRRADDGGSTSRGEEGTYSNSQIPAAALSRIMLSRMSLGSGTEIGVDFGLCSINDAGRCVGFSFASCGRVMTVGTSLEWELEDRYEVVERAIE